MGVGPNLPMFLEQLETVMWNFRFQLLKSGCGPEAFLTMDIIVGIPNRGAPVFHQLFFKHANAPGDHRFWSMFPFTRVPFGGYRPSIF